jgi:hypothetical protein
MINRVGTFGSNLLISGALLLGTICTGSVLLHPDKGCICSNNDNNVQLIIACTVLLIANYEQIQHL